MNLSEDMDGFSYVDCSEDCETSTSCPFADHRTLDEIVDDDKIIQKIIRGEL